MSDELEALEALLNRADEAPRAAAVQGQVQAQAVHAVKLRVPGDDGPPTPLGAAAGTATTATTTAPQRPHSPMLSPSASPAVLALLL